MSDINFDPLNIGENLIQPLLRDEILNSFVNNTITHNVVFSPNSTNQFPVDSNGNSSINSRFKINGIYLNRFLKYSVINGNGTFNYNKQHIAQKTAFDNKNYILDLHNNYYRSHINDKFIYKQDNNNLCKISNLIKPLNKIYNNMKPNINDIYTNQNDYLDNDILHSLNIEGKTCMSYEKVGMDKIYDGYKFENITLNYQTDIDTYWPDSGIKIRDFFSNVTTNYRRIFSLLRDPEIEIFDLLGSGQYHNYYNMLCYVPCDNKDLADLLANEEKITNENFYTSIRYSNLYNNQTSYYFDTRIDIIDRFYNETEKIFIFRLGIDVNRTYDPAESDPYTGGDYYLYVNFSSNIDNNTSFLYVGNNIAYNIPNSNTNITDMFAPTFVTDDQYNTNLIYTYSQQYLGNNKSVYDSALGINFAGSNCLSFINIDDYKYEYNTVSKLYSYPECTSLGSFLFPIKLKISENTYEDSNLLIIFKKTLDTASSDIFAKNAAHHDSYNYTTYFNPSKKKTFNMDPSNWNSQTGADIFYDNLYWKNNKRYNIEFNLIPLNYKQQKVLIDLCSLPSVSSDFASNGTFIRYNLYFDDENTSYYRNFFNEDFIFEVNSLDNVAEQLCSQKNVFLSICKKINDIFLIEYPSMMNGQNQNLKDWANNGLFSIKALDKNNLKISAQNISYTQMSPIIENKINISTSANDYYNGGMAIKFLEIESLNPNSKQNEKGFLSHNIIYPNIIISMTGYNYSNTTNSIKLPNLTNDIIYIDNNNESYTKTSDSIKNLYNITLNNKLTLAQFFKNDSSVIPAFYPGFTGVNTLNELNLPYLSNTNQIDNTSTTHKINYTLMKNKDDTTTNYGYFYFGYPTGTSFTSIVRINSYLDDIKYLREYMKSDNQYKPPLYQEYGSMSLYNKSASSISTNIFCNIII